MIEAPTIGRDLARYIMTGETSWYLERLPLSRLNEVDAARDEAERQEAAAIEGDHVKTDYLLSHAGSRPGDRVLHLPRGVRLARRPTIWDLLGTPAAGTDTLLRPLAGNKAD